MDTSSKIKSRIVQRRVQGKSNMVHKNSEGTLVTTQSVREERAPKSEYTSEMISSGRVTKVVAGGKRMKISVVLVLGDKKGKVAVGKGKAVDTRVASEKAENYAKKHLQKMNLKGNTIPHEITVKFGAAKVWMKPAAPGTGIIAGGPVRKVLETAGVKDVLTKQLGSSNPISNAYATIEALRRMKI